MEKGLNTEGLLCADDRSCCGASESDAVQDRSCTLNPSELRERLAWWKALFTRVVDYQRTPSAAVLTFDNTAGLRSELDELIKLERICCAHVSWQIETTPQNLMLTLKADASSLDALEAMAGGSLPSKNR